MKKQVILKPIQPNWAIGNAYRVKLNKLVKLMLKDVFSKIDNNYLIAEPQILAIVGDSKETNQLYQSINIKLDKWQRIFVNFANRYAPRFVAETDQSVTNQLKNRLKPYENFLVVKFSKENQQILDCIQATIQENVDLITNIPIKLKEQIQVQVTQAVSRGRDHKYLEEQLAKTGRFTENRVKLIARDQIDKATSAISHARQAELGITKQTWVYTFVSKEARQSHKAANGKVYEISKGCKIDGEYIYPAQKINCKCTSAIVLEFD